MNIKNLKTTYDINRSCPPGRIVVSHDCDVNTRTVEVFFRQGVIPLAISTDCTAKAAFVERQSNILINDNVPCTVTESGSVLIPVDNLHRQGRFDMSIELTVTNQNGEKVLVTPFPMWITVNGSILNEAEVTEESKGTVPELLEEAAEALADAKDYEKLDNLPAINGHQLIGDQTAEDLGISGGTDDYNELKNIPMIKTGEGDFVGTSLVDLPIKGTIHFDRDFFYYNSSFDKICLSDRVFKENNAGANYDFNNITEILFTSGWHLFDTSEIRNLPQFLHSYARIAIMQLCTPNITESFIRGVLTLDSNQSKPRLFFQTATADFSDWGETSYPIINQSEWVEVGGSEIVSGVVNQNGTITFTDSDGNTFTTTGASVIGPQGDDYVLTNQDKTDIANIVLQLLPTTQGVLYGNTSN